MKRGGDGVDYIRKTVDKSAVVLVLTSLEAKAERYTMAAHRAVATTDNENNLIVRVYRARAAGLRFAVDALEEELNLLEGYPSRGWW